MYMVLTYMYMFQDLTDMVVEGLAVPQPHPHSIAHKLLDKAMELQAILFVKGTCAATMFLHKHTMHTHLCVNV